MGQASSSSHPNNPSAAQTGSSSSTASSASGTTYPSALADSASTQLRENLEALHNQLMQHAGLDYDIVTTTTLSYSQFLSYIAKLNEICRLYQDDEGRVLVFAVKKGTDSSIFWKATVRIACVKYHTRTETTESYRLLNIRQFLQVFRRISYECTDGSLGAPPSPSQPHADAGRPMAPTTAASVVLREITATEGASLLAEGGECSSSSSARTNNPCSELDECVICLERKPEVILPCAHAYCLPCIQQWWEYSTEDHHLQQCTLMSVRGATDEEERTCPVCRETVTDADDTWVISEAPDDAQVTHEISKALMGLAESGPSKGGGHLYPRRTQH